MPDQEHQIITVPRQGGFAARCECGCNAVTFGGFASRYEARASLQQWVREVEAS